MKATIENQFYPTQPEMDKCARILLYGFIEKNGTQILSEDETNILMKLLKKYSTNYKQYKEKIFADLIKELDEIWK